jgi:DNA helicase II / ATP-dependent DNA helicase PcrA
MMKFNDAQVEAVNHFDGPCLVISVPGSGKTSVLVERTANLISRGVDQKNLLCITFTNKAAKEMKERICSRLGVDKVDFYVGTFHSLCANILRVYGDDYGYSTKMSIMDDGDQKDLIDKIIKQLGKDKKKDNVDINLITSRINKLREDLLDVEDVIADFDDVLYQDIVKEYFDQLKENNLVDFSGLLYFTVKIFRENIDALTHVRNLFKYIQVDEVQDTNLAQFEIINLIGGDTSNILLTGDISQSVYRFRNARYENILDFLKKHKDCKKITLGQNYRSTPEIVNRAEKLIKHNSSHMADKFFTNNPSGDPVGVSSCFDSRKEAEEIADKIWKYVDEYGWDFSDIAILYRLNKLSLELQTVFTNRGIPYTVIGGQNFFSRKEIKDSLAMMKFASNNKDMVAFYRMSSVFKGLGNKSLSDIEKTAKEKNISVIDVCKNIREISNRTPVIKAAEKIAEIFDKDFSTICPGKCLSYLIGKTEYCEYLKRTAKKEGESDERIGNVLELINNATEFGDRKKNLEAYLQNISLMSASDKENDIDSISLMTLHACKGLEFPIVFMVGVEHNILPHYRPLLEAIDDKDKAEAIEEERRICYVGMTRAKKHLNMSYCKYRKIRSKGGLNYVKAVPSQFLTESGFKVEK